MMFICHVVLTIFLFVNNAESSKMEGRIVGGHFLTNHIYPYQAFLDIRCQGDWICGGSFLNQALILTAAHCLEDLYDTLAHKVFIKYGSQNLFYTKLRRMKSFIMHPDYDMHSMYADVALVRCKMPVNLGPNVQRVAVMRNPPSRPHAFVAGWGVIDEDLGDTEILKHVMQKIYENRVCKSLHLPNGTFCAGNAGAMDNIITEGHPSLGDSGGPLVILDYIQIGIVSYRVKGNTIVAYTNVSYFMPWIRRAAHELYCLD